ncbi:MAG: hypothetical protein ACRDG8_10625 [Actinomycetota bacterium]
MPWRNIILLMAVAGLLVLGLGIYLEAMELPCSGPELINCPWVDYATRDGLPPDSST